VAEPFGFEAGLGGASGGFNADAGGNRVTRLVMSNAIRSGPICRTYLRDCSFGSKRRHSEVRIGTTLGVLDMRHHSLMRARMRKSGGLHRTASIGVCG